VGGTIGAELKAVHVLRKPVVGSTVVANVLKYGCGAINVDACRVGSTVETWPATRSYGGGTEYAFTQTATGVVHSQPTGNAPPGRWPTNVVFQHLDGCHPVGTKQVRTSHTDKPHARLHTTDFGGAAAMTAHGFGTSRAPSTFRGIGDENGNETIVAYECAPGCPVAALDAQSGVSTSTGGRASIGAFKGGRAFGVGNGAEVLPGVQPGLGDTGGASRFFKLVRS
jgi:hypothetical protein